MEVVSILDTLPLEVEKAETVVLLDGGYFVSRFSKHWSIKGAMRKADNQFRRKQIGWVQRQARFRNAIKTDLEYVLYRMGQMKVNPKYENSVVIVCYDGIYGRRQRGAIYEAYKGNRNKTKVYAASEHEGSDLREKLEKMGLEPMSLFNSWHGAYNENLEADDLMAEITGEALLRGKNVVIMSADSDMVQMLRYPDVRLHNLSKQIRLDDVLEKYGVSPTQYADWKALSGDPSDNIPGVPGIGKAKAVKLITKYGVIEDIPQELLREYKPISTIGMSEALKKHREENNLGLPTCRRRFGSAWERLEQGLEVRLNAEQVNKLSEALDISGLLSFDDYYQSALLWKRLVTLPFK